MRMRNLLRRYKFDLLDENHSSMGGFLSISPITMGVRTSKYREGDDDNLEGITLPGRRITEPIELRKGCFIVEDERLGEDEPGAFHKWIDDLQNGKIADGDVSETFGDVWYLNVLKKTSNEVGRTYKILSPVITMVRTSELDAMDSMDDVIWIESVIIEHSGVDLILNIT